MFDNRVPKKMSEAKTDEVKRKWRRLNKEELHVLYSSQNIIRVTKSGRMRWARHVAFTGTGEVHRAEICWKETTLKN